MLLSISTDAINPQTHQFDARYTCDVDNSSPEIRWNSSPTGTQCFALIMDDPDAIAGPFFHWVVFSIPPEIRHLPAGIPPQEVLPNGIRQGLNSTKRLGYFGPCPPPGDTPHRYRLTLYALKKPIESQGQLTGSQLRAEFKDHVLAQAEVIGLYGRLVRSAS